MRRFLAHSRSLFTFALVSASALGAVLACGGSDEDQPPAIDGGGDASLLNEGAPPNPDADVPIGEVCGDVKGLEENAPWPLRGGCPKRAGAAGATGPQNASLQWTLALPSADTSPSIGADRVLWVGGAAGDVAAITPAGVLTAVYRTAAPITSSPVRSATQLTIIGASDGLYAFDRFGPPLDAGVDDAGDGGAEGGTGPSAARVVWKRPLPAIASSPVIGGDGTIYVGTSDGKLVAVAADGSAVKWSAVTNDTGGSSPALATDGTIYVGSIDKKLYAIDPAGAVKWSFDTGAVISGSPCVGGDESIYVGTSDGKLHAVAPDGKPKWSYATGGPITGTPAVRGGVAYVGSADKSLHAVSVVDGKKKWTYVTLGEVGTPAIGSDGIVYVGSTDGKLYAVTPSGLLFFAVNVKGRIKGAPALSDDGALYVTSDTGVHGLGP